ncbi:MBL fold metallo-hydrolase [Marilutibacter chinensis]|uniref:MBL fold metallo-hydrolase n=1 Tax=Marilutibacter chinensis TaxID=2912247 RepID=A0ABS9HVQ2_9GAMM|nr:MBL fold metallo-hydrolase [Lysobacter chinensis]MCF7222227.1 MBL fold metallo-hydrolase [Lysobacter chinensis]
MPRTTAGVSMLFATFAASVALTACSPEASGPSARAQGDAPAASSPFQPAPTPASDDIRTFAIGELKATALRDGALAFPNDNQVFGIGHTPEEVAGVLRDAQLPTDTLQLGLQPLLVEAGERVLLFDSGGGASFGDDAGQLSASLRAAGIEPGEVTDIFISHAHGDHVGGLVGADGVPVFANASIHMSAPEWAFLSGMSAETAKNVVIPEHAAFVAALTPKVATFEPGAEIVPGMVEAVAIEGHTPGHSGYLISSGAESLLYVGDAMHHSVVSVQKPGWPNGFDGEPGTAADSRSALVEQLAASGQRAYNVHAPFPGLGRIEKQGDTLVWVGE